MTEFLAGQFDIAVIGAGLLSSTRLSQRPS